VRNELGVNGYLNNANTTWTGLHGDDQHIIYPVSWALPNHRITTSADIAVLRQKLGSDGYGNASVLAQISPADRPLIFPSSWEHGGEDGRIRSTGEVTAIGSLLDNADDTTYDGLWSDMSPSDQDHYLNYWITNGETLYSSEGAHASQGRVYNCLVSFRRWFYFETYMEERRLKLDYGVRYQCNRALKVEQTVYLNRWNAQNVDWDTPDGSAKTVKTTSNAFTHKEWPKYGWEPGPLSGQDFRLHEFTDLETPSGQLFTGVVSMKPGTRAAGECEKDPLNYHVIWCETFTTVFTAP
jgi:hypothetical protein